jgi:hypothetical protein
MTDNQENVGTSATRTRMGPLPDEFWAHRRAAKRELLLSWRSVLDAAVQRLEDQPERPTGGPDSTWLRRASGRTAGPPAVRTFSRRAALCRV